MIKSIVVLSLIATCSSILAAVPPRYKVGTIIECGRAHFVVQETLPDAASPNALPVVRPTYRVSVNGMNGLLEVEETWIDYLASSGSVIEPAVPVVAAPQPAAPPPKYYVGQIVGPTHARFKVVDVRLKGDGYLYAIIDTEAGSNPIRITCDQGLLDALNLEQGGDR